jgi:hypothetical protein
VCPIAACRRASAAVIVVLSGALLGLCALLKTAQLTGHV